MSNLPLFQSMWDHYPAEADSGKVKATIGGKVNASWITNTCVIRLSRAFNYSGDPIQKSLHGLSAVSGGGRNVVRLSSGRGADRMSSTPSTLA